MGEHGGSVVNIASHRRAPVEAGLGVYNTSKAALIHLTKQLALELAPKIRVNAVAPGVVRTRLAEALWKDHEAAGRGVHCRWAGSVSPTTSPPPSCSWPPTPRRGSPARRW